MNKKTKKTLGDIFCAFMVIAITFTLMFWLVASMSGFEIKLLTIDPWLILLGIIIFAEVLFWVDGSKPSKDEGIIAFTIWTKSIWFSVSIGAFGFILAAINTIVLATPWLWQAISTNIPVILTALGVMFGIAFYIYANSLKYRMKPKPKPKKRAKKRKRRRKV